jgi:hypothetical protein
MTCFAGINFKFSCLIAHAPQVVAVTLSNVVKLKGGAVNRVSWQIKEKEVQLDQGRVCSRFKKAFKFWSEKLIPKRWWPTYDLKF